MCENRQTRARTGLEIHVTTGTEQFWLLQIVNVLAFLLVDLEELGAGGDVGGVRTG